TVSAYLASEDEFGNAELVHEVLDAIAYREGIGDTLAEGVARCHEELGVENWSVKGLEFAAHDGRAIHGQGLSYAVANRGADHMYSSFLGLEYNGEVDPEGLEGKPELLIEQENRQVLRDSGIFCAFSGDYIDDEQKAELLDADFEELLAIGDRVVELERHFNNRRGFDRADDRLPYDLPGFEAALDEYYELRGWNADGTVPADAGPSQAAGD
ncbi:MAG: Aldehyde:ferredoxin oxidoreductase, partial [uncultured archaeon A07HR67]